MDAGPGKRFLIVVLDALRPEFVTLELMPNLHAFAGRGVRFANSRATFPTETRVNQSAVTTGCYPARHGVVANRFPLPEASPGAVLNSGDDVAFEDTLKRLSGDLLGVPTLGELLDANGKRFATVSAGTSGGGRLINISAERSGSFRLALRRPDAAVPRGIFETVAGRLGPLPEYGVPALAWNSYAVDCYLDYVEPELKPDVMLLWLSEPDESFHWHGIGAPEALGAIRHMDAEFGHILSRRSAAIDAGSLQVIAMSDHGQISLAGGKLDLAAKFNEAGFSAGDSPEGDPDCVIVVHNGGGAWVRDSDPDLIRKLVVWLRDQDWCGPVFTRDGVEGTLRHREIGVDHPRAADIVLVLSHDDGANQWGRAGRSGDNAPYPEDGGCHGGLSRYELENFIAMAGSAFQSGAVIETPAGNIDILPTVLSVLGIGFDHRIDGRVLCEALTGYDQNPEDAARELLLASTNAAGRRTHLSVTEYRGARYLNRAWVE
jgi:predicted AlkP superfamily pyrophosphatase or phosphodiesterase